MALSLTEFEALLKTLYGKPRLDTMLLQNSPFLGMIPKKKGGGRNFTLPISYAAPQNRSATFAKAVGGNSTSQQKEFIGTYQDNFSVLKVDHKLLVNSESSQSMRQALIHETEGAMESLRRDISLNLFLSYNGILGKVGSVSADAAEYAITLDNKADIVRFELGMTLVQSDVQTNKFVITAKNYENGVLTGTKVGNQIVANKLLVVEGDFEKKIHGLSDWLPFGAGREAALAAPFFGVIRATDSVKLGGVYVDAQTLSIGEGLKLAMAKCTLYGQGAPDVILMNPMDIHHLSNEFDSRMTIEKGSISAKGVSAAIGYDSFTIGGILGTARIVPDAGCPEGVAFALKLDTWEYQYLGASYLNTWNEDGIKVLREDDDNNLTGRFYSYGEVGCSSPGANAVIYFGQRAI
jgi:hypothetical protein